MEEILVTDGTVRNASFTDYLIPTALDLPDLRVAGIIEQPEPGAPFGAKGVGEPPTISSTPAVRGRRARRHRSGSRPHAGASLRHRLRGAHMTDLAAPTVSRTSAGRSFGNDDPVLRRQWHPVALAADVGPTPVRVELCGEPLVVVRLDDGVAVLPDVCPHRSSPLSEGLVVDGRLQCPYHGWQFDASGACRFIPALGPGATLPPKADLAAPRVMEAHDLIFVCLDPTAEPPMLDIPEWGAPGIHPVWLPVVPVRAGAAQLLDNFLDFSHFPFVHAGTFGAAEDALIGDYAVERTDTGLKVRYEHVVENREDPGVATGERPLCSPGSWSTRSRCPSPPGCESSCR